MQCKEKTRLEACVCNAEKNNPPQSLKDTIDPGVHMILRASVSVLPARGALPTSMFRPGAAVSSRARPSWRERCGTPSPEIIQMGRVVEW